MRRFANLYIVLFLIDAGLSLTDELLTFFSSPLAVLSAVRYLVAYLVIVLSVAIYFALGIDRRLPKRVLLPLTLYVFWSAMALWPLSGMIDRQSFGVLASFGQVFIGGVAVIALRSFWGENLLARNFFLLPLFSWRNTLAFAAVNLLLLPLVLVYSLLAVTSFYLEQATAGFMRLSPVGIYMAERSYHHDTKVVRLTAMMHVGREGYYEDLVDSLSAAGTIILAEGVTDEDRLLTSQFDYGNLAGLVGLSSQDRMRLDGNLVDLDALDDGGRDADKPDIVRADVDINCFNPGTIEFLNVLGATVLGSKPLSEGVAEYNLWAQENITPEWLSGVMADILEKRNAVVIDSMLRSLKHYDTVIIPWGAMHMQAIEATVLEQGFVPGIKSERLSLDFRTIPYGKLWRNLSAPVDQGQP